MRFFAAALFVTAAAPLCNPARADDESPDAYEIVTATALPVLPPRLRAVFRDGRDALRKSAAAYIISSTKPGAAPDEASRHFVMLDLAAVGGDEAARRAAAQRFPHDRAAAVELSIRQGVGDGGCLPWIINEHYNALVKAIRGDEPDSVMREAGALLHFVTDAALPFNTTSNRNGTTIGHLRPSDGNATQSKAFHGTTRHRYHVELLARLHRRLAYEVRVSPERFRRLDRPLDAVFDLLLETHSVVDALLAMDAETLAELGITDSGSFARAQDRYYAGLADRAASIMESRLEVAALLGANLIGTAWIEAGSPTLTAPISKSSSTSRKAASTSKPEGSYVGSRHSTIFHLATCRHAKRIKQKNRVSFNRIAEAHDAGRTPCKTCKPNDP